MHAILVKLTKSVMFAIIRMYEKYKYNKETSSPVKSWQDFVVKKSAS